jgi:hypothetical protein
MPTLDSQVKSLAHSFADAVVAAIRNASIQEILAETARTPSTPAKRGPGRPPKVAAAPPKRGPGRPRKVDASVGGGTTASKAAPAKSAAPAKGAKGASGKGGRLKRRSPADIERVIGLVVKALGEHKAGLRSEQLQKVLKLSKKEITGPLAQALGAKQITKKGEKRSTTYFSK